MRRRLLVFLLLGTVSLFADMTYEGARSVLGPYVEVLGASALVAGALAIGDFIGYSMRLLTGVIVGLLKSSRVLWFFTVLGYTVNLLSVPALAFANTWQVVLALVVLERTGKGLRTPARDVILAEVSEEIGVGKGFGLHELMDQVGAILGPLIVSLAISMGDYRWSFKLLGVPAVIAISLVITASLLYPNVKSVERKEVKRGFLSFSFMLLLTGIALLSIGFLHWSIISYYIKDLRVVPDEVIPMLYLIAMAVDATVALPAGILYDRSGLKTLLLAPILALPIPILLSLASHSALIATAVLWGAVIGLYETVMRASIVDIVEPENRAYAYGLYNFVFGVSWLAGSMLAGMLYSKSLYPIKIIMPIFTSLSLGTLALISSKTREQ